MRLVLIAMTLWALAQCTGCSETRFARYKLATDHKEVRVNRLIQTSLRELDGIPRDVIDEEFTEALATTR